MIFTQVSLITEFIYWIHLEPISWPPNAIEITQPQQNVQIHCTMDGINERHREETERQIQQQNLNKTSNKDSIRTNTIHIPLIIKI